MIKILLFIQILTLLAYSQYGKDNLISNYTISQYTLDTIPSNLHNLEK